MKYIVVANSKEEFTRIAEYYNWNYYQWHQIDAWKETYAILLNNNKPTGWSGINYLNESDNYTEYNHISFTEWQALVAIKTKEVKMKYVVEVSNEQEASSVIKNIDGKYGVTSRDVAAHRFPRCITSSGQHGSVEYQQQNITKFGPVLSYKDWALMFDIKPLKANKTLKLTSDYSAEVNYNTKIVQVGCQSIPFSKVEELAKLIKE